jgi:hypothetical protein
VRDPVVLYEVGTIGDRRFKNQDRLYLRGLTDIGDWKLLAVFDDEQDIDSWCDRIGEHGPSFRRWFADKGLVPS